MKQFLLFMTLVGVTIFTAQEVESQDCSCSNGWVGFNGYCYQFFPAKVTWRTALNSCKTRGADLVSIHSEVENNFVYDLINTDGCCSAAEGINGYAWIGYYQPSGPFVWSDGTPTGYENWAPRQPDNYRLGHITEDCGHLRKDPQGSWNDYSCFNRIGFICKKPWA